MYLEKELNIVLFDQLTILERIEAAIEKDGQDGAKKIIETIRNEITRKLYQNPPIISE